MNALNNISISQSKPNTSGAVAVNAFAQTAHHSRAHHATTSAYFSVLSAVDIL